MGLRRNERRETFKHHAIKLDQIHIISPNQNPETADGYIVIANPVDA